MKQLVQNIQRGGNTSLQNSHSSIDTEIERLRSEFSFLQSSQKVISSPSTFPGQKAAKCQKIAVALATASSRAMRQGLAKTIPKLLFI